MDDEDDDENVRKLGERIHIDYDIARGLVDEVIPYSLEYFFWESNYQKMTIILMKKII